MDKLIGDFSVGLFFWQLVLFVGLVLLLKKFAWKPILDSVNEREDGIKNALASAEDAKKEMQNLNASNEQLLKDARAERDALMKDAREIKDKMISDAKEEAKEVTSKLIENAQASIEQEKQAALAELKKQVADLSIGIAETVIKKELTSKEEQLKRFNARNDNPLKRWKFSPVDKKGQELWDTYTHYKDEMYSKTHTTYCPWMIIKTNHKKTARLEAMRYVLSKFDYDGKKETSTLLTPDPNVVMRYYRSNFQID